MTVRARINPSRHSIPLLLPEFQLPCGNLVQNQEGMFPVYFVYSAVGSIHWNRHAVCFFHVPLINMWDITDSLSALLFSLPVPILIPPLSQSAEGLPLPRLVVCPSNRLLLLS